MSDGSAFRCFANSVANPPAGMLECHFIKINKEEITHQKIMHQVQVSTIRSSSVASLFNSLSTVYLPILVNDIDEGQKHNTQLRDIMFSLKAGLQRTLRKGG